MFNLRLDDEVPGFRVGSFEEGPGFRVGRDTGDRQEGNFVGGITLGNFEPRADGGWLDFLTGQYGSRSVSGEGTAQSDGASNLVHGPGDGGGGHGWDKCPLIPGTEQFGMCLYSCPDGSVRRSHGKSSLGCQPFIFRNDGLGL